MVRHCELKMAKEVGADRCPNIINYYGATIENVRKNVFHAFSIRMFYFEGEQ